MSKPDHPDIKGCTDGGCIFGHPGGMHTNGGCRCLRSVFPTNEHSRRMQRNILLLRQEIESLKHALGHVLACSGAAGCVECRKLISSALHEPRKGRKMVGGYQDTPEGRKWLLDDPEKT